MMSATVDTDGAVVDLGEMDRAIWAAGVITLTKVAKVVEGSEIDEMRSVFDGPTDYTLRSLRTVPATFDKPEAQVKFKDEGGTSKAIPPSKYMQPQVEGGPRRLKRFERALERVGLLPPGTMAVPGVAARLDANGNMSRGQIVQILSAVRAFAEQGYRANRKGKSRMKIASGARQDYFVHMRPTHQLRQPGIYLRTSFAKGSAVQPVVVFVRPGVYKPRLRFEDVAREVVEARSQDVFNEQVAAAITRRLNRGMR
jgi:hypothetical protein